MGWPVDGSVVGAIWQHCNGDYWPPTHGQHW
jgi:hypothetical protein